jgi:hypothetical protein
MGAATGLHAKAGRGQLRDKRQPLRAIEPFTHDNRAVCIHRYEVKHLFCHVDTEYAKLLFPGIRLLLVHDSSRRLKSFWLIEAVPHRGGSISLI